MSDKIKVVVKVRPLISREIEENLSYQWRVKNNTLCQLEKNGKECGPSFTFDKVYDEGTPTKDVYNDIAKPIVEAAVAGINGTIFAYGQTSSGKTYTMTGSETAPGIIPLAVLDLFNIIKKKEDRDFLLRVAYIEIYNETIKDLLDVTKDKIKIHESLQGGVKVEATEKVTSSPQEVLEFMRDGEANRQIGATNMNEQSSRSHSIFQITIESREHTEGDASNEGPVNVSILNLVDLAGSERSGQTGAKGIRFKEGTHINKSLSALALVIKQLSEGQSKYTNYRDSKLTRILQNSLGGNAKTSIICAVTPAALEETISTLQFANRAKAIKNKPEVNAVATDATMITELTKRLSKLQSQLENKKNLEQNNRMLQKKIKALQSQILNGLGQCATTDKSRADRRKTWAAPRRMTIDTLHTINEDGEIAIAVPRFCTPVMKYNPATVGALDFQPIARQSGIDKMEPVREESVGGQTTPPPEKRVNFSDEVIEIESDDEKSTDVQLCSPYHKCYESSKTPPCVLREKAEAAQKNLNDIVELTEREKMYSPDVVELIEKLEQNTSVIADLRDKVTDLNTICTEKDCEIDSLKNNAAKAQEVINEVNAKKAELESLYRESLTKLTDLEVVYETSKKKAKSREEDLLSLLEERKIQVPTQYGIPNLENKDLTNFMDMSKDISLVNSDNETSVIHKNDDSTSKLSDIVADLQSQINSKSAMVEDLEAKVNLQKLKIDELECTNEEIQRMLDSLNLKISEVDTENSSLKSTADSLMSTIKSQKDTLDSANNDVKFYLELTEELQQKLNEKIININVLEDSVLEDLIANEEKIIANNDNLKNIIHTLRCGIDTRNKEISRLTLQNSCNDNYKMEVESKDKEINTLVVEVEKLKEQVIENIKEISLLTKLNYTLTRTQSDLTSQEESLQEQIKILTNQNQQNMNKIDQLNEDKKELALTISETEIREKEVTRKTEDLAQQLEKVYSALNALEEDIKHKSRIISTLNTDKINYSLKVNEVLNKIESVLTKLNGQNIENIGNEDYDYDSAVKHCFSLLDTAELEIIVLKESSFKAINDLETELRVIKEKYEIEVRSLQEKIESLTQSDKTVSDLNKKLTHQNEELMTGIYNTRQELERKTKDCSEFESKLQGNIAEFEKIRQQLEYRDSEIATLKENELQLIKELENVKKLLKEKTATYDSLREEIEDLNATYLNKISTERINRILTEKDKEIANLAKTLSNVETTLPNKYAEIISHAHLVSESIIYKEKLLKSILDKVTDLTNNFCIQNSFICDEDDKNIDTYEQIPHMLAKIGVHVDVLVQKINENAEDQITALENALTEAKIQIKELTTTNLKMNTDLAQHDEKYRRSLAEIDAIQKENKGLGNSLLECNDLLQSLHQEITTKALQLKTFENNTRIVKEKFISIESEMRKRINDLEIENNQIREHCVGLENHIKNHSVKKEDQFLLDVEENGFKNLSVRNSLSNSLEKTEINVPKSLLSICLSKVIQALNANDIDKSTTQSNSTSEIDFAHVEVQADICQCNALTTELATIQEENETLKHTLQFLKLANQKLIQEQEEVRTEVNLLLEPATDLRKKICKHRTNLSTLTATTYAENKALKSQVKVLQHHHSRFYNVCLKDIPQFKKQLIELYTMLKAESLIPDRHNNSIKRYSLPDVLDKNASIATFKNDSTLDGDLMMLDTNVTLTTSADSTLVGLEQTCFDITQTDVETELKTEIGPHMQVDMETLAKDNQRLGGLMEVLREENRKLKDEVENLSSPLVTSNYHIDVENTINFNKGLPQVCENNCENCKEKNKIITRLEELSEEMSMVKKQKHDLEEKYNNLLLEIPSSDALVRKLGALEKEHNNKMLEVTNLTNALSKYKRELKQLQEENDTLSNQVMDNISDADDLRKQLDILKESNTKLKEKYNHLEQSIQSNEHKASETCSQCLAKEKLLQKHLTDSESLLNISQRDLDTSLRCNKIYTLQNELDASKEDCKKITEEVATIRNHLERSNLSMNQTMDDSMGESNIFTFTKDFDAVDPHATSKFVASMPNILEEKYPDVYSIDKTECLNYYVEKTGAEKENFNHEVLHDVKIIEVMKSLYNNLMSTHGNEVQNLRNQLKSFEESKIQLQSRIDDITSKYTKACEELDLKEKNIDCITKILNLVKNNTKSIIEEVLNNSDSLKNTKLVTVFKENILKVLDKEFSLNTTQTFESLIDSIASKHQNDIRNTMESYTKLQQHMETLMSELNNVNENLLQMKEQLTDKENDYNLLKAQKERVHEISNAVTLDIVKKEQELSETIRSGCQMLLENNIIHQEDVDLSLSSTKSVTVLFERLVSKHKLQDKIQQTDLENVKEKLVEECTNLNNLLNDKETELSTLRLQNEKIKEINKAVTLDIINKESELQKQVSAYEELSKDFENKMSENNDNICLVENLRQETSILLESIAKKESIVQTLESELNVLKSKNQDTQIAELNLEAEINDFKSVNAMITEEKEYYAEELQKSGEIIRQKSAELEKMTADVLILTESVKEKISQLENISVELQKIKEQNKDLKDDNSALSVKVNEVQQNYEEKCKEITRLEMNIKTHEKSVQIQCSMVKRLQKQKDEDNSRIQELTNKCTTLERDFDTLQSTLASTREEMTRLQNLNNILETRITKFETELEVTQKDRPSLDGVKTNSRRRRQSLYDSKRLFDEVKQELDEHTKIEAMFASQCKPEDLFMSVDEDSSNRSTPARSSSGRRRDSSFTHVDQREKDEDPSSRPSSVQATRLRRQSIHDLHRSVGHTPSPRESLLATRLPEDNVLCNGTDESETAATLKATLSACRQELEELKERFREVDEECEICAEYLRERDEQCCRLVKEKAALTSTVAELKEALEKGGLNLSRNAETKRSFSNAAVNTDEDWTNLHSVVVDRMSFDAEVQKNKNLTKALEEFRLKNREYKAQATRMQKVIEKYAAKDTSVAAKELESKKKELDSLKQELEELKQRYRELDEECETCAEYLRERDEQCRKLSEANKLLRSKLEGKEEQEKEESQEMVKSNRKKRQSLHDLNRDNDAPSVDVTTDTSIDLLSFKDESSRLLPGDAANIKRLTMMVERLSRQKKTLEQQLANSGPLYVATGSAIVQNQQISDVIKENQRLKKQNIKLVNYCKKRGKSYPDFDQENNDTAEQG